MKSTINILIALLSISVLLVGCGGGGGGGDTTNDTPNDIVQDVSAIGLWTGSVTDGDGVTFDVTGVISPDNDICIYSFEYGTQYVGSIDINGDVATGTFTGYAPEGFTFYNGETITTGTMELDIVEESSIVGTYSSPGDSGSFNLQYLPDLENPTTLADAAGTWTYYNASSDWAEFTIDQDGTVVGIDNWGCQLDGAISVMDSAWRIYYVTVSVSTCSPYDGDYSGLMIMDEDGYLWSMITSSEYSAITRLEKVDDTNTAPVANAGTDQSVLVGDTVTLDGSLSSDADGDSLIYTWIFMSGPPVTTANLSDVTIINPTFTPDIEGEYVFQLSVYDGKVVSYPATVTVNAYSDPAELVSN